MQAIVEKTRQALGVGPAEFEPISLDRYRRTLHDAEDFAQWLRRQERLDTAFDTDLHAFLVSTSTFVFKAPLPQNHALDTSIHNAAQTSPRAPHAAAESPLPDVLSPDSLMSLTRDAPEVARSAMQQRLLLPVQLWLQAYDDARDRYSHLDRMRLKIDAKRRKLERVSSKRQGGDGHGTAGTTDDEQHTPRGSVKADKAERIRRKLDPLCSKFREQESDLQLLLAWLVREAAALRGLHAHVLSTAHDTAHAFTVPPGLLEPFPVELLEKRGDAGGVASSSIEPSTVSQYTKILPHEPMGTSTPSSASAQTPSAIDTTRGFGTLAGDAGRGSHTTAGDAGRGYTAGEAGHGYTTGAGEGAHSYDPATGGSQYSPMSSALQQHRDEVQPQPQEQQPLRSIRTGPAAAVAAIATKVQPSDREVREGREDTAMSVGQGLYQQQHQQQQGEPYQPYQAEHEQYQQGQQEQEQQQHGKEGVGSKLVKLLKGEGSGHSVTSAAAGGVLYRPDVQQEVDQQRQMFAHVEHGPERRTQLLQERETERKEAHNGRQGHALGELAELESVPQAHNTRPLARAGSSSSSSSSSSDDDADQEIPRSPRRHAGAAGGAAAAYAFGTRRIEGHHQQQQQPQQGLDRPNDGREAALRLQQQQEESDLRGQQRQREQHARLDAMKHMAEEQVQHSKAIPQQQPQSEFVPQQDSSSRQFAPLHQHQNRELVLQQAWQEQQERKQAIEADQVALLQRRRAEQLQREQEESELRAQQRQREQHARLDAMKHIAEEETQRRRQRGEAERIRAAEAEEMERRAVEERQQLGIQAQEQEFQRRHARELNEGLRVAQLSAIERDAQQRRGDRSELQAEIWQQDQLRQLKHDEVEQQLVAQMEAIENEQQQRRGGRSQLEAEIWQQDQLRQRQRAEAEQQRAAQLAAIEHEQQRRGGRSELQAEIWERDQVRQRQRAEAEQQRAAQLAAIEFEEQKRRAARGDLAREVQESDMARRAAREQAQTSAAALLAESDRRRREEKAEVERHVIEEEQRRRQRHEEGVRLRAAEGAVIEGRVMQERELRALNEEEAQQWQRRTRLQTRAAALRALQQEVLSELQRYEQESSRSRRMVEELSRQEPSLAQEEQRLEQERLAAEHRLAAVEDKRRDTVRRAQELTEQQRQQQLLLGAGGVTASLGPVTPVTPGDTAQVTQGGAEGVRVGELSRERLEAARREAEEDEREIERAREALRRAETDRQAARTRVHELERRRREAEQEAQRTQIERTRMEQQLAGLQGDAEDLVLRRRQLMDELQGLGGRAEGLRRQRQGVTDQVEQLEQEKAPHQDRLRQLEEELALIDREQRAVDNMRHDITRRHQERRDNLQHQHHGYNQQQPQQQQFHQGSSSQQQEGYLQQGGAQQPHGRFNETQSYQQRGPYDSSSSAAAEHESGYGGLGRGAEATPIERRGRPVGDAIRGMISQESVESGGAFEPGFNQRFQVRHGGDAAGPVAVGFTESSVTRGAQAAGGGANDSNMLAVEQGTGSGTFQPGYNQRFQERYSPDRRSEAARAEAAGAKPERKIRRSSSSSSSSSGSEGDRDGSGGRHHGREQRYGRHERYGQEEAVARDERIGGQAGQPQGLLEKAKEATHIGLQTGREERERGAPSSVDDHGQPKGVLARVKEALIDRPMEAAERASERYQERVATTDTPGHPGDNTRITDSERFGNAEQRAAGGFSGREVDVTNGHQGEQGRVGIVERLKEAVIERPREKMQEAKERRDELSAARLDAAEDIHHGNAPNTRIEPKEDIAAPGMAANTQQQQGAAVAAGGPSWRMAPITGHNVGTNQAEATEQQQGSQGAAAAGGGALGRLGSVEHDNEQAAPAAQAGGAGGNVAMRQSDHWSTDTVAGSLPREVSLAVVGDAQAPKREVLPPIKPRTESAGLLTAAYDQQQQLHQQQLGQSPIAAAAAAKAFGNDGTTPDTLEPVLTPAELMQRNLVASGHGQQGQQGQQMGAQQGQQAELEPLMGGSDGEMQKAVCASGDLQQQPAFMAQSRQMTSHNDQPPSAFTPFGHSTLVTAGDGAREVVGAGAPVPLEPVVGNTGVAEGSLARAEEARGGVPQEGGQSSIGEMMQSHLEEAVPEPQGFVATMGQSLMQPIKNLLPEALVTTTPAAGSTMNTRAAPSDGMPRVASAQPPTPTAAMASYKKQVSPFAQDSTSDVARVGDQDQGMLKAEALAQQKEEGETGGSTQQPASTGILGAIRKMVQ